MGKNKQVTEIQEQPDTALLASVANEDPAIAAQAAQTPAPAVEPVEAPAAPTPDFPADVVALFNESVETAAKAAEMFGDLPEAKRIRAFQLPVTQAMAETIVYQLRTIGRMDLIERIMV